MNKFNILLSFLFFTFILSACAPYKPPASPVPVTAHDKWKHAKNIGRCTAGDVSCFITNARSTVIILSADAAMDKNPERLKTLLKKAELAGYPGVIKAIKAKLSSGNKTQKQKTVLSFKGKKDDFFIKILKNKPSATGAIYKYFIDKNTKLPQLKTGTWIKIIETSCIYTGEINTSYLIDKLLKSGINSEDFIKITVSSMNLCPGIPAHLKTKLKTDTLLHIYLASGFPVSQKLRITPKTATELKFFYILNGNSVLKQTFKDYKLKALQLKLTGNVKKAVDFLMKQPLPETAAKRLKAAKTAVEFMDYKAALRHLRVALGYKSPADLRTEILLELDKIMRITEEPGRFGIISEAYKLSPRKTLVYLENNLYFPQIMQLAPEKSPQYAAALASLKKYKAETADINKSELYKYWAKLSDEQTMDTLIKSVKNTMKLPPAVAQAKPEKRIYLLNYLNLPLPHHNFSLHKNTFAEDELFSALNSLLQTESSPQKWLTLLIYSRNSPWLPLISEAILYMYPASPQYSAVAVQGFVMSGKTDKAELILLKLAKLLPDTTLLHLWATKMYLKYGVKSYAGKHLIKYLESSWFYPHKQEAEHPGLRLFNEILTINFLKKTNDTEKLRKRLDMLFADENETAKAATAKILSDAGFKFKQIRNINKSSVFPVIKLNSAEFTPSSNEFLTFVFPSSSAVLLKKCIQNRKIQLKDILKKGIDDFINPSPLMKSMLCKIMSKGLRNCSDAHEWYAETVKKCFSFSSEEFLKTINTKQTN